MQSEDQRAGLADVRGGTAWSAGLRPPLLSKAELNRRQLPRGAAGDVGS